MHFFLVYVKKKQYLCTQNGMNMKKQILLLAFMAVVANVSAAVTLDPDLKAALPSGEFFLPAPPAEGSLVWKDDSAKYFQYKEAARKWDDVKQDRWDSAWAKMNEQYYFALYRLGADSVMNAPFLTDVSWTKSGSKWAVNYTRNTTDFAQMNALEELCEEMKNQNTSKLWRTRTRPYSYFGDWYSGRKYAVNLADTTSYPSGHGYFAGLFGMCMLYIDPENALAIHSMMNEWMNCRLLVGAHWNTDLSAGVQLGAIAFAIAMNHDQFRNLVEAAKTELESYREQQSSATGNDKVQSGKEQSTKVICNDQLLIRHDGKFYNAQGTEVK